MNKTKVKKVAGTHGKNKNKTLITVICTLALLITAFVIFWDTISIILPDVDDSVYRFSYPSSQSKTFTPFKNNMVFCCNDGIYCIDKKGNEKWMVPIVFDNPVVAASDSGVVVSSKNSKTVYIINEKGKTREFSTQNPVLNLKMTENGNILTILDKQNYSGAIEIYDKTGLPLFTWSAGSVIFVDAALSPNGRTLAISSITTENAVVDCQIKMFDIYKDSKPYAENSFSGNMISQLKWANNSRLVGVGDKSLIAFDKKGNQKWEYPYDDKVLNFVSINDKNNMVLALGTDSLDQNMTIKSINLSGKLNSEFTFEGTIRAVAGSDNRVLICTMENANVYDRRFRLRETLKAEKEIHKGYLLDGNTVFLDEGGFAQLAGSR